MEYSVLITSGWQGSGWHLVDIVASKAEAETIRDKHASRDAKSDGYITCIVRSAGKPCMAHQFCRIYNISRRGEPHLVGRSVHVDTARYYEVAK